MRIRTFQGLVPAPGFAERVAAVPYDVVNREEAAALAASIPENLLHVDRAEIDLPADVDPYADEVYAKALQNFRRLQEDGVLVREGTPSLYLYQQEMNGHRQTGIAAVCHIDDYGSDVIRKHEKTRKVKEDDRTRLIDTLGADTGPVFLTYRDQAGIDRLVERVIDERAPTFDMTASDGVRHRVWRVSGQEAEAVVHAFGAVPLAYVADGHHRSASAWRVGDERRSANPRHDGSEDYNWFLCVLFPAEQLRILGYNRVVRDLNGLSADAFLQAVGETFRLEPSDEREPTSPGQVRMYVDGRWHSVAWDPDPQADPVNQLDVSVLQERLLHPILGVGDPRTDERIDFIGGIRGPQELERLVDSGRAAVAFSLYPVTVDQLMAIADAGQIMPPKSTWFEPKLRSGFFIHTF